MNLRKVSINRAPFSTSLHFSCSVHGSVRSVDWNIHSQEVSTLLHLHFAPSVTLKAFPTWKRSTKRRRADHQQYQQQQQQPPTSVQPTSSLSSRIGSATHSLSSLLPPPSPRPADSAAERSTPPSSDVCGEGEREGGGALLCSLLHLLPSTRRVKVSRSVLPIGEAERERERGCMHAARPRFPPAYLSLAG